jgi:hypothetical protein
MVESEMRSPVRNSSYWNESANNDLSMVYENPLKKSPSMRHDIFMRKQEILKSIKLLGGPPGTLRNSPSIDRI